MKVDGGLNLNERRERAGSLIDPEWIFGDIDSSYHLSFIEYSTNVARSTLLLRLLRSSWFVPLLLRRRVKE